MVFFLLHVLSYTSSDEHTMTKKLKRNDNKSFTDALSRHTFAINPSPFFWFPRAPWKAFLLVSTLSVRSVGCEPGKGKNERMCLGFLESWLVHARKLTASGPLKSTVVNLRANDTAVEGHVHQQVLAFATQPTPWPRTDPDSHPRRRKLESHDRRLPKPWKAPRTVKVMRKSRLGIRNFGNACPPSRYRSL